MGPKSAEDLQDELDRIECAQREREISDKLYAAKLVERIVYGGLGVILIAILTALMGLVLRK